MGLIDRLRRAGGILKNRLASAVGAVRTQARAQRVRIPRRLGLAARVARLTSPLGIGITAATFAPQILAGLRRARGIIGPSLTRGVAFVGGQRVVTAAGAGGVVGILSGRREGKPGDVTATGRAGRVAREAAAARERRPAARRAKRRARDEPAARRPAARRKRRKRIPSHRHKVISVPVKRRAARGKRRTHSRPRHKGHKRVSFTTADGRKVSFLANPAARHR